MTRKISTQRKILFSLLPLIILFTAIEGIIRILPASSTQKSSQTEALPFWVIANMEESNFVSDRLRFWKVPANTPRLHTNSIGLRGPEFSRKKEDGVFRVITMGDSCTWGFGVNPGLEYANQLAYVLNKTTLPLIFEIQNAGVPGYSSLQGLRYLEHEILDLDPDIITLYFGRNDRRNLQEEGGYAPDHEVHVPPLWASWIRTGLNHSRLYQILRNNLLALKPSKKSMPDPDKAKRIDRKYRVEANEFETNFTRMIEIAQARGIQVIAITASVYPSAIGNYNEIVRKICIKKNVWLLDAEPVFRSHNGNGWLVDDCHPNPSGHQWIANQLADRILKVAGTKK